MLPLAGHTVIALFPIAPIYCSYQICYPYGFIRRLTRSKGVCSIREQMPSNKHAFPSRIKGHDRTFHIVALVAGIPLAIIYAMIHKFNIVLAEAFM